jgi:hypothetical protein
LISNKLGFVSPRRSLPWYYQTWTFLWWRGSVSREKGPEFGSMKVSVKNAYYIKKSIRNTGRNEDEPALYSGTPT